MGQLISIVGTLASLVWLALAITTIASSVLDRTVVTVNALVACVFLIVALHLGMKQKALRALIRSTPPTSELKTFQRFEGVAAVAMLGAGLILLTAAAYRLFVEAKPVFG